MMIWHRVFCPNYDKQITLQLLEVQNGGHQEEDAGNEGGEG